jgi:hypothetical protein
MFAECPYWQPTTGTGNYSQLTLATVPLLHHQAADSPGIQERGADFFLVEIDCGFVPIEDCPFDASVISFFGDFYQAGHERGANSPGAVLGLDEQVFEVKARFAEESRKVFKKERKASRLAGPERQEDFNV